MSRLSRYQAPQIRGVEAQDEVHKSRRTRDHRTVWEKIRDRLETRLAINAFFTLGAALSTGFPETAFVLGPLLAAYYLWLRSIPWRLPYSLPIGSPQPDHANLSPDRTDRRKNGAPTRLVPGKANGICLMGADRFTGEEIWASDTNLRAHGVVLGTTGSGKTEALLSLVANALAWGSGYSYIDGKGDASFWVKNASLCRRFGRDDDLLLLSYLIGKTRGNSNTINFFATGAADVLTNTFTTLLDDAGSGNDMWKQRAMMMAQTAITVAVELRDRGLILFNVNTLRQFTSIEVIIDLYCGRPISCGIPGTPDHIELQSYALSPSTRSMLNAFIETMPGFDKAKAQSRQPQGEDFHKQTAFLTMQMTKILGTLCDVYSYVFSVPMGEIDMEDVVTNRRVLAIMLPSLEKSPDETANLGKIIISAIKSMMGNGLMSERGLMGDTLTVLDSRPTASSTPFIGVFDEIGYYFVRGLAVQFAQGRSLGFSLWPAGQDIAAMTQNKAVASEVTSVLANSNFQAFGKITDVQETAEFFAKTVDKATRTTVNSLQKSGGAIASNYTNSQDVHFEEVARASFLDVKDQAPGQFHFVFGSRIVRALAFFANPKADTEVSRNEFIMVRSPAVEDGDARKSQVVDFAAKLARDAFTVADSLPPGLPALPMDAGDGALSAAMSFLVEGGDRLLGRSGAASSGLSPSAIMAAAVIAGGNALKAPGAAGSDGTDRL